LQCQKNNDEFNALASCCTMESNKLIGGLKSALSAKKALQVSGANSQTASKTATKAAISKASVK